MVIFTTQSERKFLKTIEGESNLSITSDGSGYYAYLPASFIYKDFQFKFLGEVQRKYKDFRYLNGINFNASKNEIKDKYYIGTSVLMSPFFLANCLSNQFTKGNFGDGYDKSFQKAMRFSALFYFLVGIIGLILFFKTYLFSNYSISFVILGLSLGTSLSFYSVYYPSFSHVYSFFAVAWFFYFARKFVLTNKSKHLIATCFFIALITLIRPTNILIIFILPFLFPGWKTFLNVFIELFKNRKKVLSIGVLIFLCFLFLQLLNVYLQTNQWNPNTYSDENFDFLYHPQIVEVLIGYRKGLLTYAPFLFLIIPGLIILFKKNRYLFWGWVFVFSLNLYLISSWWCWWYGGGLGMRPFVDFSILLVLPIVFLLEYITTLLKLLTYGLILFSIYIFQVFQYQFNTNVIDYEKMTSKIFWQCFLDTSGRFAWQVFFENEALPKTQLKSKTSFYYNSGHKIWESQKQASSLSFGNKEIDLDIHQTFFPDSMLREKICFKIHAELWIAKPETNPGFLFKYFKHGWEIYKKDFHLGSRISQVYEITPITLTHNPNLTCSQVDSVQVFFTRNIAPTAIKNLQIDYLLFEKK